MEFDDDMDIDIGYEEWLDKVSDARMELARIRASNILRLCHPDSESLMEIMESVLMDMYEMEQLYQMCDEGLIEITGVDKFGEIEFSEVVI